MLTTLNLKNNKLIGTLKCHIISSQPFVRIYIYIYIYVLVTAEILLAKISRSVGGPLKTKELSRFSGFLYSLLSSFPSLSVFPPLLLHGAHRSPAQLSPWQRGWVVLTRACPRRTGRRSGWTRGSARWRSQSWSAAWL